MSVKDKILKYAAQKGAVRIKEIEDIGVSRRAVYRLCEEGELVRVERGIYSLRDFEPTENHTRAAVAVAVPGSVVCLLSALQLHGLTTQMPHKVWIALERKANRSNRRFRHLPVTEVRFTGDSFSDGIEKHVIEGVEVQVYSAAKTVADCFKFRNKIGIETAIEALSDCIHSKKATRDQIWQYAKTCRVSNVIRPYMEAII